MLVVLHFECPYRRSGILLGSGIPFYEDVLQASLNSKERYCILSRFLTHFSSVFLCILLWFSTGLKKENISLWHSPKQIYSKSQQRLKNDPVEFCTRLCKVVRFYISVDSYMGGNPLEYFFLFKLLTILMLLLIFERSAVYLLRFWVPSWMAELKQNHCYRERVLLFNKFS